MEVNFVFNYASLSIKPYSGCNESSSQLLKRIINFLSLDSFPNENRIINRYQNRKEKIKRDLIITKNVIEESGRKYYGNIALIKDKSLYLLGEKNILSEIKKEDNKKLVEISRYVIEFSENADPIIMFEFNNEGPRVSDFEYYLRQIAVKFEIAKSVNSILHVNQSISDLENRISNIFNLTVKVNSLEHHKIDWFPYFFGMQNQCGYKDVKLEFFYAKVKDKNGIVKKNIRGLDFVRKILRWLKEDENNIDYINDLKMSYAEDNSSELVSIDLLKNKHSSSICIKYERPEELKRRMMLDLFLDEFNYYLSTGKTRDVEKVITKKHSNEQIF